MRYLADTHVLIWAWQSPELLSKKARTILSDGEQTIYFSIASIWEVAIKVALGKLRLHISVEDFAKGQVDDALTLLPIRVSHAARLSDLPLHHRDPFDRMLVAQALEEDLKLITSDSMFANYPIGTLW